MTGPAIKLIAKQTNNDNMAIPLLTSMICGSMQIGTTKMPHVAKRQRVYELKCRPPMLQRNGNKIPRENKNALHLSIIRKNKSRMTVLLDSEMNIFPQNRNISLSISVKFLYSCNIARNIVPLPMPDYIANKKNKWKYLVSRLIFLLNKVFFAFLLENPLS